MPNGGWQGSNRGERLPPDWHKRRARCYRAARGRCANPDRRPDCAGYAPLNRQADGTAGGHADHIDRTLGEDGPLQWLCPGCHNAKSSAEGHHAAAANRAKTQHPRLTHPALR